MSECEDGSFLADWVNATTPFTEDAKFPEKCERFSLLFDNYTADFTCSPEYFDPQTRIECEDYVYEDEELTILNQVSKRN